MASLARDTSIPEVTRNRAMMREGSTRLRKAIYAHFGVDLPKSVRPPITIKEFKLEPYVPLFGELLLSVVADEFNMTPQELKGDSRVAEFVEARALVADVLRHRKWSYPRIGRLLDRDHSTVINLLEKLPVYLRRSEQCQAVHAALAKYRVNAEDVA